MKRNRPLHPDAPLQLTEHGKPMNRREFIARGMLRGAGLVSSIGVMSLFSNPRAAYAALAPDLEALKAPCGIAVAGAGKIPFICFDLAGGASIAGSNVLVGGLGGQEDFLSTAGYSRLGVPGNMVPSLPGFMNRDFGLAFHSDSQFLAGIAEKAGTRSAFINGAVIPARSENDTANNPHNPLYGIFRAGANGELLATVGSRSSDSGGNSVFPPSMFDSSARPTKIDRPSDVTGLVSTGKLVGLLDQSDAVAVMESIARISRMKLDSVSPGLGISGDDVLRDMIECGYIKAADIADRFGDPAALNVDLDADIVGDSGIFSAAEFASDGEFRKTASIMKLVVNGYAGAGCVTLGGYDYHTGERGTGELRDLRAGRCIGACLEYAARRNTPLMVYVFSDGSVASNGRIDDSVNGRGKGEWTGDSSATAASFFLVYNPGGQPQLVDSSGIPLARRQQLGYMRSDGSVETSATPAANNPNLLVEAVLLNYMALHGEVGEFATRFPTHSLGNSVSLDRLTAFQPIVSGTIF
ncbi:general secretion pathway protein GspF [Alcanivorax sp. 1008]|uniref:general secretion pathway protein GspF n=1 Tax=Alcanivorax sp. 1008 TaxID=2816853 RepID=UPI001DD2C3F9|nr:general secretion pathway protein GspF [Alcanivorax sp. 1008]MCC1496680.1 general secretion pathway protein GspF [Alcanivorax sp. 1008]